MENFQFTDNTKIKQFEFNIDGYIAKIEYLKIEDTDTDVYLMHTEVPSELSGRGIAGQLTQKTLEYIDANGWRMVPVCPFVVNYVKRNTQWMKLLKKGVEILT